MQTSSRGARRRVGGGAARPRRWAALLALAALLTTLAASLPVGTAGASTDGGTSQTVARPDFGKLTPTLAREADAAAGQPDPGPKATNAIDNTPGGLERNRDGQLTVDAQTTDTSRSTINALTNAGGAVESISAPQYNTVTVSVAPSHLRDLAALSQVKSLQEVIAPITSATCAPIVSEGDVIHKANVARQTYNVDGTGVPVGILSDSFNTNGGAPTHAAQDVANGELPGAANPCGFTTPVNVVDDTVVGEDEGRGMAQTVHSLAPGSPLAFATAFTSETGFANNIIALKNAGAKVIVDDVTYFDEPMFQDGPISNSVSTVRAAGIPYFSSAANNNLVDGTHNDGSYEALTYRGVTCPTLPSTYLDCHNFDPNGGTSNTESMTVASGATLRFTFQWANPWGNVTTDYDVYVLNANGNVVAQSTNNNGSTQKPFEFINWRNNSASAQTVRVVVARNSGPGVRFKLIHIQNGAQGVSNIQFNTSAGTDVIGPTIFGHNGAPNAFSVAAVNYNVLNQPEFYSSHGPVTLLFQPVPNTGTLNQPVTLNKPDFAAVDCVRNSFFGFFDGTNWRFCGTSDAAPHAAAIAALLLQANPTLSPNQIGGALYSTAIPVGTAPTDQVGGGLLQADGAVGSVLACTHTLTGAQGPTTISGGTWCINGATFSGSVTVAAGTTATFVNSTVNGNLAAKSPAGLRVCGTTVTGTLVVSTASKFVLIGDPGDDGCAANTIGVDAAFNANTAGLEVGSNQIGRNLTLQNNSGVGPFPDDTSIEIEANTITGNLGCVGNSSVTNGGQPNTVNGARYSQCGAPGF